MFATTIDHIRLRRKWMALANNLSYYNRNWNNKSVIYILVKLGFSSKSETANRSSAVPWVLEQADKMSSGSLNEVDMFKVKSQLIYFVHGNSTLHCCQYLLPVSAASICCQFLLPVSAASFCCQYLLPVSAASICCQYLLPVSVASFCCQVAAQVHNMF